MGGFSKLFITPKNAPKLNEWGNFKEKFKTLPKKDKN
jgi:hypothetical protein